MPGAFVALRVLLIKPNVVELARDTFSQSVR
jgi:hypothetical protein